MICIMKHIMQNKSDSVYSSDKSQISRCGSRFYIRTRSGKIIGIRNRCFLGRNRNHHRIVSFGLSSSQPAKPNHMDSKTVATRCVVHFIIFGFLWLVFRKIFKKLIKVTQKGPYLKRAKKGFRSFLFETARSIFLKLILPAADAARTIFGLSGQNFFKIRVLGLAAGKASQRMIYSGPAIWSLMTTSLFPTCSRVLPVIG